MTTLFLGLTVFIAAFHQDDPEFTNTLGQRFVRIAPGSFEMGLQNSPLPEAIAEKKHLALGDYDERTLHTVHLTRPFHMAVHEVTNAEYERFDPGHRSQRGKGWFSREDDEAVIFVSWEDATRYCAWLSDKEGLPYRLPTEAEWEYACRAGTMTPYSTGDTLPESFLKNAAQSWYPDPERSSVGEIVPLTVGQTPPNAWGLYDMHGNVEEWCHDWHGPYGAGEQRDPVGAASGTSRITRGGSHGTLPYYLRSSNRSAALPEERSWYIGFRVVIGAFPDSAPTEATAVGRTQEDVSQDVPEALSQGPDPNVPYFLDPREYVKIPSDTNGPLYWQHNHVPSLAECPNGDLLAVWYTCVEEPGREAALAASRLRFGSEEWEPASLFWNVPDRTIESNAMWLDESGRLMNFIGLSAAATWGNLITVMRTSDDSGATWDTPRIIIPDHNIRHMPIESVFRAQDGSIIVPCDAVTGGNGGTALWMSDDEGARWRDAGGTIAGIHAGVAQLSDGRLFALGRGDSIDGKMPISISNDMGKTWEVRASVFPPIGGSQRLVLRRLQEGPLFLVSFARAPKTITITDAAGVEREVTGLFSALSYDEGETWTHIKLVRPPGREVTLDAMDGHTHTLDQNQAEPRGYMAFCQAKNGVMHLISSRQHYAFNLAWAETPMAALEK